jgi:hypothetical protein
MQRVKFTRKETPKEEIEVMKLLKEQIKRYFPNIKPLK